MNPGLASWIPLSTRRGRAELGTVLVLGATGISGGIAVENAYALGATGVVAVGRDPDRLARLVDRRTGAESLRTVAVTGDREADATRMVAALAGRPPGIVIDFVWGAVAESAFRALGHPDLDVDYYDVSYVQIGTMAGPDASLPGAVAQPEHHRER